MFLNRAFFNFALGCWSTDTGILEEVCAGARDGAEVSTLGKCVSCFKWMGTDVGTTLGDGASIVTGSGIVSTRFNCFANVSSALRTGSPAYKLGVVVDGGAVIMVMISSSAYLGKSASCTCGNGTLVGKL